MADTAQLADTKPRPTVSDDDVTHLVCHCNADLGLCGIDLTGWPWVEDDETPCPICFTLEDEDCPRCEVSDGS